MIREKGKKKKGKKEKRTLNVVKYWERGQRGHRFTNCGGVEALVDMALSNLI